MPVGLDGNSNPTTSERRDEVLRHVANRIVACGTARVVVGVDGRPGSGKSTFGDEVARHLRASGSTVIRSTTDSFHRPRTQRLRRGATSARGYFEDSHQVEVITDELLLPFSHGSLSVRTAAFDEPTDRTVHEHAADLPSEAVLIFDGLFLQRTELKSLWDVVIYLEADHRCDLEWLTYLTAKLPLDPTERAAELDHRLQRARWPRYRQGWQLYIDAADPRTAADVVVDNNVFAEPSIVRDRTQPMR